MCGIIGFAGQYSDALIEFAKRGLLESEGRGKDATGFYAITDRNVVVTDKRPIRAKKFIKRSQELGTLKGVKPSVFIGHCRATSTGAGNAKENRNNHPFIGHNVALVHNGWIPNFRSEEYAGLGLRTNTDSEVILRLLDAGMARDELLSTSIDEAVKCLPVESAFAVAAIDIKKRNLFLFRNDKRPLWVARIKENAFLFASTDTILKDAVKNTSLHIEALDEVPVYSRVMLGSDGKFHIDEMPRPITKKQAETPINLPVIITGDETISIGMPPYLSIPLPPPYHEVKRLLAMFENPIVSREELQCLLNLMSNLSPKLALSS